jgi:hypothetical protein
MPENQSTSRFELVTTIIVAVVVMIAALVAWRASLIDDASGDADYDGLRAAVRAVQARALSNVNAYESYGNYVSYWRNKKLSALLAQDLETADAEQATILESQLKIADDLTNANADMFEMRYLNRDGSYSVQRQLGEMWADVARKNQVDYMPLFASADQERARTRHMLVALMILSISPVFFALLSAVESKVKYVFFALGMLCMFLGSVLAILVEMGKF